METYLLPTPLSVVGKPILMEGEVEIKHESDIAIVLQQDKVVVKELLSTGDMVLTNFRVVVIVQNAKETIGWQFHLSTVAFIEDCSSGILRKSTRILFKFNSHVHHIGIKFKSSSKQDFLVEAQRAHEKRSWLHYVPKEPSKVEEKKFSIANAGVGGLIRRQERDLKSADNLTKEALTDLDALMRSAREVVTVVQRFAATVAQEREGSGGGGGGGGDNFSETTTEVGETNAMETLLQNIGIISPVTKYSAGRMYHKELSRQLSDVLLTNGRLEQMGGMATLTDLYCLYNRARGTEMVSPDDFHKAAELVNTLGVGLRYKLFPSGVQTIHVARMDDAYICQQLQSLANDAEFVDTGLSASTVSTVLHVAVIVAKEQLLIAEQKGVLCRDESIQGLSFFANKFDVYAQMT